MVLIDALYVNDGGGKVLLEYLIECLEESNIQVFYLLDYRLKDDKLVIKESNKVYFLKPSLLSRFIFYRKNSSKFSKVLCFGNLPPSIKLKVDTYTYFQQALFLETPVNFHFLKRINIRLKVFILNFLKYNTKEWVVQSENIKNGLINKYKINPSSIHSIPFYPPIKKLNPVFKRRNSFLYISNGYPHKNHVKLIDAFCMFYDKFKIGELQVTLSLEYKDLINKITLLQKKNYPIVNLGFLKREELSIVYANADFLIYPSLVESFGLGIIEAIENGCKVIGADLPYMHAICKPSLIFDPNLVSDIFKALEDSLNLDIKKTIPKVRNEIDVLIEKLK